MHWIVLPILGRRGLCCDQLGNSDQVVSDQIEHEVCGDVAEATVLGLAQSAVSLIPSNDFTAIDFAHVDLP